MTQTSQSVRVLVVDDHPLICLGLQSMINSYEDFTVVGEADNGERACALAQELQPDVILMDVHMPRMNGINATRRIKTTHPKMIIVGLSVDQNLNVEKQMKAAGASTYLTKGTHPDDLRRAIHFALTNQG